jgi:hypothetical protein
MTFSDIASVRLVNQQLSKPRFKSAAELVQWLAAIQGQEYAQAKWALGLRVPSTNDAQIERDFTAGKILRTHLLRPTWHIVSARDIHWMLKLSAPRVHQANAYMYRQLELTENIFKKSRVLLAKTLEGGNQLTRDDINVIFKKNNIVANGHRLSYIMMHAELEGLICSGARQGNQFTYALMDERVKTKKDLNKDEALSEFTRRYFASRGPASIKDFATWSGLTTMECKRGLAMHKSDLKEEIIGEVKYYCMGVQSANASPVPTVHLLPIYDELIMGYKDREAYFKSAKRTKPPAGLVFDNMIAFDGQIIGTWKRVIESKSITMTTQFFKPLTKIQTKAFDDAVNRFATFNGKQVVLK